MEHYLTALDAAYEERVKHGQPTGLNVSPALWSALKEANRIVLVAAQIHFTASDAPGAGHAVVPLETKLPTFRGALVHVAPELTGGAEYEFSAG